MRVFTETVGEGDATLTCYVLDSSEEMASAAVRPAALILPGGGYFMTSDREAEPVAMAYLAEGFNAFVLRYAVGPEAPFERSFADGRAALAWVRAHADDLGVDPRRVAAIGFSAGGHLAASLGTVAEEKPDALVLGYPVTLPEFGASIDKDIADTVGAVSRETPPTFLFSTSGDTLVPIRNSLAFLSALADHDVPFETHIYLLGPHGISLAKPLTANGRAALTDAGVAGWVADSVRFLQAVLGDFAIEGEPESYERLAARRGLGLATPLRRLLADARAVAVLQEHLPQVVAAVQENAMAGALSLRELAGYEPDVVTQDALAATAAGLEALNPS